MRSEKNYMVEDIRRRAAASETFYLFDYSGMTVERMKALRARLAGAGAEVRVVKNRLLRVAGSAMGWPDLGEMLRKPTAMVTGGDELAVAKILKGYADAEPKPILIKGGLTRGARLTPGDVLVTADLPSNEAMRGIFVGTLAAPMTRLAGVLRQKAASLVYVLKAAEGKKS